MEASILEWLEEKVLHNFKVTFGEQFLYEFVEAHGTFV